MFCPPFFLLLLALCVQPLVAVDSVVDLGYAKYRGTKRDHGIMRWAGMRYARRVSRIDGMRFAAPQDPLREKEGTIIDAEKFGPICIGIKTDLEHEFGGRESEDCLFVNVFAPAGAKKSSLLPVYVFIQGGGFNDNGNADFDATKLIKAADDQLVVVNFNYRVGPYGFLASQEIADHKNLSLNNGLKDQRQLLKWVQSHIGEFGGDANHITLGGASAGAGSVIFQLTAYGGRNDSLFHAAFAESPSFPPLRNVKDSQFAYDALLRETKCADLPCLRELDAVIFQKAVKALKCPFPPTGVSPPIYFWNPTLDDDLIQDYTINEFAAGHVVHVPTVIGDTSNEGVVFTPQTITSRVGAVQFLTDQYPSFRPAEARFSRSHPKGIQRLWSGPERISLDRGWRDVASNVYGHIRYTCGSLNFSAAYANEGSAPAWHYRWNVGEALHVGELGSIWEFGGSKSSGGDDKKKGEAWAGALMQGFLVSFARSFDPNAHMAEFLERKGIDQTAPRWDEVEVDREHRLVFGDQGVQMEGVPEEEKDMCELITGMGVQVAQATMSTSAAHPGIRPCVLHSLWWLLLHVAWLGWWRGT